MSLLTDIARGMLARRKRQTLVSVLGVALGVGFFIGTAAVMRGFQTYFISQIIDVQPHITIKDELRRPLPQAAALAHPDAAIALSGLRPQDRVRGIRAPGDRLAILEAIPGAAAAPLLTGQALMRYGARELHELDKEGVTFRIVVMSFGGRRADRHRDAALVETEPRGERVIGLELGCVHILLDPFVGQDSLWTLALQELVA